MASEKTETPKESPSEVTQGFPSVVEKPDIKEQKRLFKKLESKPIYPQYAGYSCPICGSKRLTNDAGKYICPVNPKPSDCPVS